MENTLIAIVDDDAAVREAATALLRSMGYATATFSSAEEFLRSGLLRDTACLITDVQMPGMSGIDLQRHLAEIGAAMPMIFVTGFPEELARTGAVEAGAFGFLPKPFSEKCLIACLDRALAHSRAGSPQ